MWVVERIRYLDDYKLCELPATIEERYTCATREEADNYVRRSMEDELDSFGDTKVRDHWTNEEVAEYHNDINSATYFPGPRVAWEVFEIVTS